ncbi:DUF2799 domain-containing protein [Methylicorpusculum sp.]|uniref:DUF2799 domain-containing protein n=1 Tax=Methylicorpusculum sp. TaxID=2713644 RepID=UPI00271A8540|nr:DUF2799 domain-containing protein [Methylicorpusculum sp.]MDO9239411.1 DUF2799 domain-containing protein [Methylicorpusculum sp.]MDP2179475.1 DUF2799 domain-containing protein [Methylicorpusculum sp.]MDP3529696.1 DUF2799 domain-containing protein [Methylicorpusculum sp.]MDZ4149890.1 DUF2799 domain-containing protein [Methylicorpusculum sp.]
MHHITGILSLIVLTGCATLNKQDCMHGDWYGVGSKDGLAGETSNRLSDHIKACNEYGIAVDNNAYMAGREQGLRDYCRLDNAFTTGLNGQPYHHVCPPHIDSVFANYHSTAYKVHEDQAELDKIDNDLSSKESQLRDKKLSEKDRSRIRDDIRSLDRQRDRVRDNLHLHERQLDYLRHEARTAR